MVLMEKSKQGTDYVANESCPLESLSSNPFCRWRDWGGEFLMWEKLKTLSFKVNWTKLKGNSSCPIWNLQCLPSQPQIPLTFSRLPPTICPQARTPVKHPGWAGWIPAAKIPCRGLLKSKVILFIAFSDLARVTAAGRERSYPALCNLMPPSRVTFSHQKKPPIWLLK